MVAAAVCLGSASYAQVTIPRPENGKLRETTNEKSVTITVDVTDKNGKTIPSDRFPRSFEFGTNTEPTIQIPIPTQVNRSDNGEAEPIVDVTKTITVAKNGLPGEMNNSSIEAIFFDPATKQFDLGNIFGVLTNRVGGEEIIIPNLFADTNGDGLLGPGDLLYTLVDLNVYLNLVPTFSLGDSSDIVNGQVAGLPGMMFSTTPFVFSADSGFAGTPFTGVGAAEVETGIAAVPEPATWAMMLLGFLDSASALTVARERPIFRPHPRSRMSSAVRKAALANLFRRE